MHAPGDHRPWLAVYRTCWRAGRLGPAQWRNCRLHRPGHIKALDIDAGTAAGARQARRYSLFCLSLHTLMPTSSLAMRLFLLTQSRGTKTGQHESPERCFLSVIQNQEPRVRSLQEEA
jgi:hypothetical protein